MSHRIRSRGRRRAFPPSTEQPGSENRILCHPSAHRPSWPGLGLVGTLTGVTPLPSMTRSCQKDQELQRGCHRTCWRAAAAPCHLLYSVVTSPTPLSPSLLRFQLQHPRGGCSGSRRWQEAVTLPWTNPLLPSLLPASFPGTLLEIKDKL